MGGKVIKPPNKTTSVPLGAGLALFDKFLHWEPPGWRLKVGEETTLLE